MGSSAIWSHYTPPAPHPTPCLLESWAPVRPDFDDAVAAGMLFSRVLHSSFPHWFSGSLKHSLPPLSLCALCSPYFCDLHVAEIFVKLNYFYTWAFHVASILRSVSFGWRLRETCSLRSVESFRYWGALLWAGCPLLSPRGFPARSGDEMCALPVSTPRPPAFRWRCMWLVNSDSLYEVLEGLGLTQLEEQVPPAGQGQGREKSNLPREPHTSEACCL